MAERITQALLDAARAARPSAQRFSLKPATIRSEEELTHIWMRSGEGVEDHQRWEARGVAMSALSVLGRNQLEKVMIQARERESSAGKALQMLAVAEHEPWLTMSSEERRLRVQLRAVERRLGSSDALKHACAYEHWHRMLLPAFSQRTAFSFIRITVFLSLCRNAPNWLEVRRVRPVDCRLAICRPYASGYIPSG